MSLICHFFFSSRRRHTRCLSDWSSDVCSSDLKLHDSITAADYIGISQAKLGLPTNSTLTSSANPVGEGFILTLTAHVMPASPGSAPTGTVTFNTDGGITLGSAPVDATGYAELS